MIGMLKQIISREVYERTKENVTADFKDGKFDLPDIEPVQAISDKITEE